MSIGHSSALDQVPTGSLLAPLVTEQRAFILLKARRAAEAEPFARRAIGVRRRPRGAAPAGLCRRLPRRRRPAAGADDHRGNGRGRSRRPAADHGGQECGQAIDSLPKAFAEVLTAFSADIARMQRELAADRAGSGRAIPEPAGQRDDGLAGLAAGRAGPDAGSTRVASIGAERRSADLANPRTCMPES